VNEDELRPLLRQLAPPARDALRRTLIADQPYRDALAERLLRTGAQGTADLLDFLTLQPGERQRVIRLLGEIEAGG
jgi:hypothetical protein